MNDTLNVVAVGDTTQDIFLKMHDASLQCDINDRNCLICFDYANKIAVDQKTDIPAVGNAANHAIGAARLGLQAALYTIVGDDEQGHKAVSVLKDNNVRPDYVTFDKDHGTNLSIVINFRSERTIFVYHEPRNYQLPDLATPQWMYLTSVSGDGVAGLHAQVEKYLTLNARVKLAFNPGTYQMRLGKEKLRNLLARTDILFLNRDEAARVLEVATNDIEELMKGFFAMGVNTIVITDGSAGSYASSGPDIYFLPIFSGPVIERTGCGDAYGSGFLSAIIQGKTVTDAMLWGNANSTSVVQYIGAREGLLTADALLAMIEENKKVRPEILA